MQQNVGKTDRIIRIVLGAVVALVAPGWWKLLAIPLAVTGLIGWCGLYTLLGKSTCPMSKK